VRMYWKRAIVIMCAALLVAGPLAQLHNAAAQQENAGMMLQQAKATNDKARAELHDMMMQMDSMSNMPMSSNEKNMMKMMHQMAEIVMMLIDANQKLISVVEHGQK
jgi:Tfp pilus assembly protein PilN